MYGKGQQVVERGSLSCVGTVVAGPEVHGGESYFRVNFNGRIKNVLDEDLEVFIGDQDPESLLLAGKFGDHIAFARRLTMSKLRRPLRDTVYSYKASRTDFHAYQFKPLLKFLSSDRRRLLIADEVGLGKTIEAGYILQEERARFGIQRVLIVCPASLRTKWQNELWQRFGEEFEVLDRASFMGKAILREGQPEHGVPKLQAIVSLQSLRSNKVIEALEQRGAPIDLLIVDEAHHCRNNETKQYRVVRALSDVSEATLLLTATPIHLGDWNLFNLLRLLLPEEFDRFDAFQQRLAANRWVVEAETTLRRGGEGWRSRARALLRNVEATAERDRFLANPLYRDTVAMLDDENDRDRQRLIDLQDNLAHLNLLMPVMTRTRKRDVYPDAARRDAHIVTVDLTPQERQVYDRMSEFCFDRYSRYRGDFAARFALITFQRQLASSLQATLAYYEHATSATVPTEEIDEDLGEPSLPDDVEEVPVWSLLDDSDFPRLIRECHNLLGKTDGKLEALIEILRRPEKVVLFSYFKRSLTYIEQALIKAGISSVRIDGDVPSNPQDPDGDERMARIKRFREDPSVRVLLSSEVGSEGLDFQFCHVIVNWDLPWNPMVVEQRIGRLDRLGQKAERILVFSFSCPGTIEDLILTRLYARIGVFERTIGVLEPILGQEIKDLTDQLLDTGLSREERESLIEQKALALAQRVRDEERLESESANLVGHDEFFTEQIERVRRLGRFVTGDELRVFVGHFLEANHPTCVLASGADVGVGPDGANGRVYRMRVVEALRDFVRAPLARNDQGIIRFLTRTQPGRLLLTFSDEEAMRDSHVELITASHPLVRSIAQHYENNPSLVHPVTALEVPSALVPPGEYLFLWASVEESGVRAGRSLWAVVVSAVDGHVVDPESSEALLHHMILGGRRWDSFESPPGRFTQDLLEIARRTLLERHQEYRRDVRDRNNALVEQRLASLTCSYRVKRIDRERRLAENMSRGNDRAVKLFEAQLRKLDSDFDERCRQFEEQRKVSVSWILEGAGYVRVVA